MTELRLTSSRCVHASRTTGYLSAFIVIVACVLSGAFRPVMAEPDSAPISVIRVETDGNLEKKLNGAYRAYQAGDIGAARFGYEDVLRAYPDNRDALMGLAACAFATGDVKTANSLYRRILRAFPKNVLASAALIGLQADQQGEAALRELLSKQPDEPYLHAVLGQLLTVQARWSAARQAFSAAHRLEPANPVHALNIAISLDRMGRHEEAIEYYRSALKLARQDDSNLDIRPVIRRLLALRKQ